MTRNGCWMGLLALTLLVNHAAATQIETLDLLDRGRILNNGEHYATTTTALVGYPDGDAFKYRVYFQFDLTEITTNIESATLRLYHELYSSSSHPARPSLLFQIFDVATPANDFASNYSAGPEGLAIYNDLGSGNIYGSIATSAATMGTMLEIPLNATALADLNSASGGVFTFGGFTIPDSPGANERYFLRFGGNPEDPLLPPPGHQLVLTVADALPPAISTPEPSSVLVWLALFTSAGVVYRMRGVRRAAKFV